MSNRKFNWALFLVVLLGVILNVAHGIYICRNYPNSSIIQFIARELWL